MNATLHFHDKDGNLQSVQAKAVELTMTPDSVTYALDQPIDCSQTIGPFELKIERSPALAWLWKPRKKPAIEIWSPELAAMFAQYRRLIALKRQHIAKARGKNWRSVRAIVRR
jgi:hypothetical protein